MLCLLCYPGKNCAQWQRAVRSCTAHDVYIYTTFDLDRLHSLAVLLLFRRTIVPDIGRDSWTDLPDMAISLEVRFNNRGFQCHSIFIKCILACTMYPKRSSRFHPIPSLLFPFSSLSLFPLFLLFFDIVYNPPSEHRLSPCLHPTIASLSYELATRQILQSCNGRGCRGFRDFEVPLLMVTISDGITVDSGTPLTKVLRPYYRPEVTMVRYTTRAPPTPNILKRSMRERE